MIPEHLDELRIISLNYHAKATITCDAEILIDLEFEVRFTVRLLLKVASVSTKLNRPSRPRPQN